MIVVILRMGVLISTNYKIDNGKLIISNKLIESFEASDSIIIFTNQYFQYNRNLRKVVIPASVTSLGSFCFDGCWSLISLTIPVSVTFLGDFYFR
jgi:hypothetical protein